MYVKMRENVVFVYVLLHILLLCTEALVINRQIVKDDTNVVRVPLLTGDNVNGAVGNLTPLSSPDQNNALKPNTSVTTTTTLRHSDLPPNWALFCSTSEQFVRWKFTTLSHVEVDEMIQINCLLNDDSHLYLSDFRLWQSSLNNTGPKVAIKVVCSTVSKSSFHATWPLKERNLVYIEVQGCRLPDYYSEYYNRRVTEFPDQLRVLELRNCTPIIKEVEVFALIENITETTPEVECGPVTVEKMVYSDFSFDIEFLDYGEDDYEGSDYMTDPAAVDVFSDRLWTSSRRINYFCDFKHLVYMEETWEISRIHVYSMEQKSAFDSLRVYNLSHAGLMNIPDVFLDWGGRTIMDKLQVLDLTHNFITDVVFYGSGFQTEVGRIDLRYNNISRLTKLDIKSLKSVKTAVIDIRYNPINCSCSLLTDFYEFLKEPDLGPYEYLREMKCVTPPSMAGRMIGDLSEAEINCQEGLYVMIAVLSFSTLVLLCVVVILVRYRREIVILVYTRLHIVLPCQPAENCDSKEYDAFISYSSKDDAWVLQTLVKHLEQLETGPGLKLCVHHRDFELGAAISENVVRSVESSRHTIMVISENFIQSEWCIYEFRTALYQSLLERRKHLIIVILENIPKSKIDPDLRKCLETFTYIEAGDKLFWDKMVYKLTIGTKRKSIRAPSSSCDPCEKVALQSLSQKNKNSVVAEKV